MNSEEDRCGSPPPLIPKGPSTGTSGEPSRRASQSSDFAAPQYQDYLTPQENARERSPQQAAFVGAADGVAAQGPARQRVPSAAYGQSPSSRSLHDTTVSDTSGRPLHPAQHGISSHDDAYTNDLDGGQALHGRDPTVVYAEQQPDQQQRHTTHIAHRVPGVQQMNIIDLTSRQPKHQLLQPHQQQRKLQQQQQQQQQQYRNAPTNQESHYQYRSRQIQQEQMQMLAQTHQIQQQQQQQQIQARMVDSQPYVVAHGLQKAHYTTERSGKVVARPQQRGVSSEQLAPRAYQQTGYGPVSAGRADNKCGRSHTVYDHPVGQRSVYERTVDSRQSTPQLASGQERSTLHGRGSGQGRSTLQGRVYDQSQRSDGRNRGGGGTSGGSMASYAQGQKAASQQGTGLQPGYYEHSQHQRQATGPLQLNRTARHPVTMQRPTEHHQGHYQQVNRTGRESLGHTVQQSKGPSGMVQQPKLPELRVNNSIGRQNPPAMGKPTSSSADIVIVDDADSSPPSRSLSQQREYSGLQLHTQHHQHQEEKAWRHQQMVGSRSHVPRSDMPVYHTPPAKATPMKRQYSTGRVDEAAKPTPDAMSRTVNQSWATGQLQQQQLPPTHAYHDDQPAAKVHIASSEHGWQQRPSADRYKQPLLTAPSMASAVPKKPVHGPWVTPAVLPREFAEAHAARLPQATGQEQTRLIDTPSPDLPPCPTQEVFAFNKSLGKDKECFDMSLLEVNCTMAELADCLQDPHPDEEQLTTLTSIILEAQEMQSRKFNASLTQYSPPNSASLLTVGSVTDDVHARFASLCQFASPKNTMKWEKMVFPDPQWEGDKLVYLCFTCKSSFARRRELEFHFLTHRNERCPCVCLVCGKVFVLPEYCDSHACHHDLPIFTCQLCGSSTTSASSYLEHWLDDHFFDTPLTMARGENPFHRVPSASSMEAREAFASTNVTGRSTPLTWEEKTAVYRNLAVGILPEEAGYRQSRVPKDPSVHQATGDYWCSQCEISFTWRRDLEFHYTSHIEDNRPSVCHVCGRVFSKADHTNRHAHVHNLELFVCQICGEEFHRNSHLEKHWATVHFPSGAIDQVMTSQTCRGRASPSTKTEDEVAPEDMLVDAEEYASAFPTAALPGGYLDELLTRESSKQSDLFQHQSMRAYSPKVETTAASARRVNDRRRSLLCSTSPTLEKERAPRRAAAAVAAAAAAAADDSPPEYDPERPYRCRICPRAFKRSAHLVRHERELHNAYLDKASNKQKPFIVHCQIANCNARFPRRELLCNHMQTVHGKSAIVCKHCDRVFTTNGALTNHAKTHERANREKLAKLAKKLKKKSKKKAKKGSAKKASHRAMVASSKVDRSQKEHEDEAEGLADTNEYVDGTFTVSGHGTDMSSDTQEEALANDGEYDEEEGALEIDEQVDVDIAIKLEQ